MDLIIGVGEIGSGLSQLFKKCGRQICGYDINPVKCFGNPNKIDLMHICLPYSSHFVDVVKEYFNKWKPKGIVIHSTVKPGTTNHLHNKLLEGNVVYSPIRGVHTRMLLDLKRYTKFYSSYLGTNERLFCRCFQDDCGLKVERLSTPFALEIAKIVIDSGYYGWMIVYGQLVDKLCVKYDLDYDELWKFAEEIDKFLGNRPKFYVDPKGIGGHCVLQNLNLVTDLLPELKNIIVNINEETKKRYKSKNGAS